MTGISVNMLTHQESRPYNHPKGLISNVVTENTIHIMEANNSAIAAENINSIRISQVRDPNYGIDEHLESNTKPKRLSYQEYEVN